jgi:tetratricopeptide (TPR) repeat protein
MLASLGNQVKAQTTNSADAARNWSLFFEYHKNGDFVTAAPYGWRVIQLDPVRFKTVYSKLAECYYNFYQNKDADSTTRQVHADTMIMIYDLGIKNVSDRAAGLWLTRGYALATYFQGRDDEAISSYEKAIELDPKTDFAYIDQLGVLYMKNMDRNPEYRIKAIALYRKAHDTDPNNQIAVDRLKQLISDPQELVELAEADLKNDSENPEKIWNAAQAHIDAEQFGESEKHLLKLVKKFPKAGNYWNELAKVYQRQGKFKQAISGYETSLKINPAIRENKLNIAVCYRQMKDYTAARSTAQKAAKAEAGWGQPYIEIAEIYKAAVENCIRETKEGDWAKLDIDDKLVYRLAQMAYERAKSTDKTLASESNQRINELSTLVPAKEDLFFNRARIVNGKMAIAGQCYKWVNEEVPVSL